MSIPTHCLNLGSVEGVPPPLTEGASQKIVLVQASGIFQNMGVYTPSTLSVCMNTGLISYLTKKWGTHIIYHTISS